MNSMAFLCDKYGEISVNVLKKIAPILAWNYFHFCDFYDFHYKPPLVIFVFKIIRQILQKIIFVEDAFTVQKGHIKCTVPRKEANWPPF